MFVACSRNFVHSFVSLVPRPPPFFVLWFSLSIIHGSRRACIILNENWRTKNGGGLGTRLPSTNTECLGLRIWYLFMYTCHWYLIVLLLTTVFTWTQWNCQTKGSDGHPIEYRYVRCNKFTNMPWKALLDTACHSFNERAGETVCYSGRFRI